MIGGKKKQQLLKPIDFLRVKVATCLPVALRAELLEGPIQRHQLRLQ